MKSVVRRFSGKRIAVIGDLILDEFIWGRVDRISPEAPVPVVQVMHETQRLGGAANVAFNLISLGATPLLAGVIGEDQEGLDFLRVLGDAGVGDSGVVKVAGRRTTLKTRIIAHHQQVCRTDRECRDPLDPQVLRELGARAFAMIDEADAVILSDYSKGVLARASCRAYIERALQHGKFVAVDPKQMDFAVYREASIITPNKAETEKAAGVSLATVEMLHRAGQRILEDFRLASLLVTRGEEGMTLFTGGGVFDIPTVAKEVFDVTGAGDTVISTLCLAVASGASMLEAALLANHAAGVVVGKLGTAAASREDILRSLQGAGPERKTKKR